MAVWSIVKYSELDYTNRLDPEYYEKSCLDLENQIKGKPWGEFNGDFISGPFGSAFHVENYLENSDYRYVRGKDVKPFVLLNNDNAYIPEKDFKRLKKYSLKPFDLLISVVGTLGNVSIVPSDIGNSIFSCKSTVYRASDDLDPFFLSAYLNSSIGQKLLLRLQRGFIQTGINLSDLRTVPIPPLASEDINEISELVKSSLNNTSLSRSLLAEAEGMLLAELGLDKLELPKEKWNVRNFSETQREERIDGEYYLPKYYALLEQLKTNDTAKLGDIVKYKKGTEVGRAAYEEDGVPFWRVSDLSKEEIGGTNTAYITEELYESLKKKYEAKQGEILFSKDATPGLAYFVREPLKGIICGGILRLQLTEDLNPDYLTLLLNSEATRIQIEREGGGSIINHLRPVRAMNLTVPILPKEKQDEIGDKVEESHSARAEAKRLLEEAKRKVEEMILEG